MDNTKIIFQVLVSKGFCTNKTREDNDGKEKFNNTGIGDGKKNKGNDGGVEQEPQDFDPRTRSAAT